jgi:hypothetical protein
MSKHDDDAKLIIGGLLIANALGVFDDEETTQKKTFENDYGLDEETAEKAVELMDEEGLDEDEAAELAELL